MTNSLKHTEETRILFGKRLKARRLMSGYSIRELVSKLDVKISPMAISKYENGKTYPSTDIISALAKVFDVKSEDFLHPFGNRIKNIEFRKDTVLSMKKINAIEKTVQSHIERYADLMDECGISIEPASINKTEIKCEDDVITAANALRKEWGIEDQFISILPFLEKKGFILYEIKETEEEFDGISGKAGDFPIIVIRKNLNPEMKRFTALHELGHLMLEFCPGTKQSTIEKYCQKFAQEVLLPTKKLTEIVTGLGERKLSLLEFAIIQRKYGIAIDIMISKAAQCNLISSETLNSYKQKKERIQEFKQFAVKSRYIEETCEMFTSTLYAAYTNKVLSIERAAYYLNLSTVSFVDRYQIF
ncbi:MAG: XRE family transcriptional regulator [Bacteroidales bacterium]|nr:XRE family transcriptional regulator [Bacteroidales bacterium]